MRSRSRLVPGAAQRRLQQLLPAPPDPTRPSSPDRGDAGHRAAPWADTRPAFAVTRADAGRPGGPPPSSPTAADPAHRPAVPAPRVRPAVPAAGSAPASPAADPPAIVAGPMADRSDPAGPRRGGAARRPSDRNRSVPPVPPDEFEFLEQTEPASELPGPTEPERPDGDADGTPGWLSQSAAALGVGRARLDPGRRGTRALVGAAVVAVIVVGVIAWQLRPVTDPVAAPTAATGYQTGPQDSGGTRLVVSVVGRVRQPGLVRLSAGARVADAIDAAGGLLPGTDTGLLNLARKVVDGEQILVGITPSPVPPGAGGTPAPDNPINLNTATEAELEELPGIGPALAGRILDYRTEHGGFRSVDELKQVSGIGEVRFGDLKDLVTV